MNHFLLLLLVVSCATTKKTTSKIPPKSGTLVTLDHKWFKVHYDPKIRLARYVEYTLEKKNLLTKGGKRKDKFIADPMLEKSQLPYATPLEYKKTGFDRGHLAPARDFSFSQEANNETFVMSNMAPQTPNLNRGAWLKLEEQVRYWACGEEKLTVITGPIFVGNEPRLPSGLIIPQRFFKIVIDETPPRKTRAYIHHQKDPKTSMNYREFPVSEVERATGLTFHRQFPHSDGDWKSENCLPESRR
jgi:endonuclease G